jgi:uncharacterized membrane protein
MRLSEVGEARIRGYLYLLTRSLRSFLPADVAKDAVREVESHIRERVEQIEGEPDEHPTLERLLEDLGSPLKLAQIYAAEMTIEEAVTTGRASSVARALWHGAGTTVGGFFMALGLLIGYLMGLSLLGIAVLKPLFPENVGLVVVNGIPRAFGAIFPLPAGGEIVGGYWVVPVSILVGLAILVGTHKAARKGIMRLKARRESWRSRLETRL